MKNLKRILGVLLILIALILGAVQTNRLCKNPGKENTATAQLLVAEMRSTMRSHIDNLFTQVNEALSATPRPDEMKLFDVLKAAKDSGMVFGAFAETSAKVFMDPHDIEERKDSPFGYGLLTLSTTGSVLPSQDDLDAISKFEQEKLRNYQPLSTFTRYLMGEKESDQLWLVRPFQTHDDTTVKELGVGFIPLPQVDPHVARLLNETFPKNPLWQTASRDEQVLYALELISPNGEIAYAIGDKKGKALAETVPLNRTDLAYSGWTIKAWMPKSPSQTLLFIVAAVLLIAGLIFVIK